MEGLEDQPSAERFGGRKETISAVRKRQGGAPLPPPTSKSESGVWSSSTQGRHQQKLGPQLLMGPAPSSLEEGDWQQSELRLEAEVRSTLLQSLSTADTKENTSAEGWLSIEMHFMSPQLQWIPPGTKAFDVFGGCATQELTPWV